MSNYRLAIVKWGRCLAALVVVILMVSSMAAQLQLPQAYTDDLGSPNQSSTYNGSQQGTGTAGRQQPGSIYNGADETDSLGQPFRSSLPQSQFRSFALELPQLLSSDRILEILQQEPELSSPSSMPLSSR